MITGIQWSFLALTAQKKTADSIIYVCNILKSVSFNLYHIVNLKTSGQTV